MSSKVENLLCCLIGSSDPFTRNIAVDSECRDKRRHEEKHFQLFDKTDMLKVNTKVLVSFNVPSRRTFILRTFIL